MLSSKHSSHELQIYNIYCIIILSDTNYPVQTFIDFNLLTLVFFFILINQFLLICLILELILRIDVLLKCVCVYPFSPEGGLTHFEEHWASQQRFQFFHRVEHIRRGSANPNLKSFQQKVIGLLLSHTKYLVQWNVYNLRWPSET